MTRRVIVNDRALCENNTLTPLQLWYIHMVMAGEHFGYHSPTACGRRPHWKSWNDLIRRGLIRITGTGTYNDWFKPIVSECALRHFVPSKVIEHREVFDWPEVACKRDPKKKWWNIALEKGWTPPTRKKKKARVKR